MMYDVFFPFVGRNNHTKQMLENTEGAIKNDNPEKLATRQRKTKLKHNNMCRTPLYANKYK